MGWALALHGGAGKILDTMPVAQREEAEAALAEFLDAGIAALQASTPALEVVELVVRLLEGSPIFNAGLGSVLTTKGTIEMEASIMDGVSKRCGAVSGLHTVVHPISLARLVMEKTAHVYLAFAGAEAFARGQGVETKDPSYFITPANQEKLKKALETGQVLLDHNLDQNLETPLSEGLDAQLETVGCVAVDSQGHCAAATSTGGLVNKMVGRIGDTPLIGAGTYADQYCAVSATGRGEEIIRAVAAKEVSALMEYKSFELNEAVETVVCEKTAKDTCGLIAVSSSGDVTTSFNTLGMYRASATENGFREIAIWETVNQNGHVKPERVNGHSKPVGGNGHAKPIAANGLSKPVAVNGNGHAKPVTVNGRTKSNFANGHIASTNGHNSH